MCLVIPSCCMIYKSLLACFLSVSLHLQLCAIFLPKMHSSCRYVLFSGVHQKTTTSRKWSAFPKILTFVSMCRAENRNFRIPRGSPKTSMMILLCSASRRHINMIHDTSSLHDTLHGSLAGSQNQSSSSPWCVLFSARNIKRYRAYRSLLLCSSTKRVSSRCHVSTTTSPSHTAFQRYRTFQR